MRKFDLHVHTSVSPCSGANPASIVSKAVDRGLDGIAITDHDTVRGVHAVERAAPPDLTILPGVEVTTTTGHMLALGVRDAPSGGDPITVAEQIQELGGVAVLAHPFDTFRQHYSPPLNDLTNVVDAVEVRNSRCLLPRFNQRAMEFAVRHGLPVIGGSDAHFPIELGRAVTVTEGEPLMAIESGTTVTSGRSGYVSGHVATKVHELRRRVFQFIDDVSDGS